MNKVLVLFMGLMLHHAAFASVIPEIEDYYTKKASEYVQTRFPQRPYTVFVKVDAGEARAIKRGDISERKSKSLPYLDVTEDAATFGRAPIYRSRRFFRICGPCTSRSKSTRISRLKNSKALSRTCSST